MTAPETIPNPGLGPYSIYLHTRLLAVGLRALITELGNGSEAALALQ